jgi:hypothetical protein
MYGCMLALAYEEPAQMMCMDASIAFILAYKVKPDDVQTKHGWGNAETGNMNLIMSQSSSFVGKSILGVSIFLQKGIGNDE